MSVLDHILPWRRIKRYTESSQALRLRGRALLLLGTSAVIAVPPSSGPSEQSSMQDCF